MITDQLDQPDQNAPPVDVLPVDVLPVDDAEEVTEAEDGPAEDGPAEVVQAVGDFRLGQTVSVAAGSVRTFAQIAELQADEVKNGQVRRKARAKLRFLSGKESWRGLDSLRAEEAWPRV
jgi:hypothetical protein